MSSDRFRSESLKLAYWAMLGRSWIHHQNFLAYIYYNGIQKWGFYSSYDRMQIKKPFENQPFCDDCRHFACRTMRNLSLSFVVQVLYHGANADGFVDHTFWRPVQVPISVLRYVRNRTDGTMSRECIRSSSKIEHLANNRNLVTVCVSFHWSSDSGIIWVWAI